MFSFKFSSLFLIVVMIKVSSLLKVFKIIKNVPYKIINAIGYSIREIMSVKLKKDLSLNKINKEKIPDTKIFTNLREKLFIFVTE